MAEQTFGSLDILVNNAGNTWAPTWVMLDAQVPWAGIHQCEQDPAAREYLPATTWLAWVLRRLGLTPFVTAVNRLLGRIRRPLGRFFPDPWVPRRWP